MKTTTQTTAGGKNATGKNVGGSQGTQRPRSRSRSIIISPTWPTRSAKDRSPGSARIWADGKKLNQSEITRSGPPRRRGADRDDFLEAKEGGRQVPAYRGIAYVVFDDMPLDRFGNRLPQLNFEVFRAVDDFESQRARGDADPGGGRVHLRRRSRHPHRGRRHGSPKICTPGWRHRLRRCRSTSSRRSCPTSRASSLVVSWFGTDLRIGHCEMKPGVEVNDKGTEPYAWSVSGITRETAYVVSQSSGRPAYGGTPSDRGGDLGDSGPQGARLRRHLLSLYLHGCAGGEFSAQPLFGGYRPAAYPWRGRITCDPVPGEPGTVDKTGACATQVAAFVGEAGPSDFTSKVTTVPIAAPRMVVPPLHPALRSSVRGGRRRRCLHHRLGDARRHDAEIERDRAFPSSPRWSTWLKT